MQRPNDVCDVLVIGGGTAGHVAAIQAARAGADTTVIEQGAELGGTMTTGGVNAPQYFYAGSRQVIAGIGWDLVCAANALDNDRMPDFSKPHPHRPGHTVWMNRHTYAALAEEAALEAGVRLHYHELLLSVSFDGQRWHVETAGKGTRRRIQARELIDATGDADVVDLLGLPRQRDEQRQPGTFMYRLGGIDLRKMDLEDAERRYAAAMAAGQLRKGDFWRADVPFRGFLKSGGANQMHVPGADVSTSEGQSAANIAGRESMLRMLRFVRGLPGGESARIEYAAPFTTARDTWRIVGETTITVDDYRSGRMFPDAVCYSFYFIDVHTDDGLIIEDLPPGIVPTIPHRALIPQGSQCLQVAGRTLSSDRLAFSGLRVQASCMAMGQAVGAAAALAVRQGVPSRDVPPADIHALLAEHGAIVPVEARNVAVERR